MNSTEPCTLEMYINNKSYRMRYVTNKSPGLHLGRRQSRGVLWATCWFVLIKRKTRCAAIAKTSGEKGAQRGKWDSNSPFWSARVSILGSSVSVNELRAENKIKKQKKKQIKKYWLRLQFSTQVGFTFWMIFNYEHYGEMHAPRWRRIMHLMRLQLNARFLRLFIEVFLFFR